MKALFILGPTAVGKTDISIKIAKRFNGEIISCDSVQIFKGLDIGSAKIRKKEMQNVTHHLIDIKEPEEEFTAYDYACAIKEKITQISQKGKLPIICGGTSLYVKSVILNYNFGGAQKDDRKRAELESILEKEGLEALVKMLEKHAPEEAAKIDLKNPVRVIRALEIALNNGEKKSSKSNLDTLIFAIVRDRQLLYDRINMRVDIMLKEGLVDEVRKLKERGLTKEHQSMKAIGYKEVLEYLDGDVSYEKMVENIKQHSRNYAKRQLTFLRGMENVNYVDSNDIDKAFDEMSEKIQRWLNG